MTWQFWIHTESIKHMGSFMEFFFNTPSHHRVHHGRNPFCIDKNYAGVLIIWDRIFGTFQSEYDTDEKVQYGLVQNVRSFDPTYIQFGYLQNIFIKARIHGQRWFFCQTTWPNNMSSSKIPYPRHIKQKESKTS